MQFCIDRIYCTNVQPVYYKCDEGMRQEVRGIKADWSPSLATFMLLRLQRIDIPFSWKHFMLRRYHLQSALIPLGIVWL